MVCRKTFALAAIAFLVFALTGCGSPEPVLMPDVTGKHLDVAKSDIERAGHSGSVEVVGGGVFGILDESNWTVCEQEPAAGAEISDPRLVVDRECGGGQSGTEAPTPSETPSGSASPEASAPAPSEAPTESAPPADVIDTTLGDVLDRLNSNQLNAGEVLRFDAELWNRDFWSVGATGFYSVDVKVPGSSAEDNQDYFVLLDDAAQARDWSEGEVMTFVVEDLDLEVNGDSGPGWFKVLSAEPAAG